MNKVKMVIERNVDAFWVYSDNVEGINNVGESITEVKNCNWKYRN